MMQTHQKQSLEVYFHEESIGKLYLENGSLSFAYDKTYLTKQGAQKLSMSLPLQSASFDHQTTTAFFSGLLPDGTVRERLARYLHLSEKNTFALLKAIGGECAGAISLYTEGNSPKSNQAASYRILAEEEAHNILSTLDKHPMLVGEEDIRISGAGAQDKLIIVFVEGKIAIPTYNTPSTHIIKPAIKDLESTVQNEFFCMTLAKMIGLPVPGVQIHWLKDDPYYLIERYDRIANEEGKIVRLHQEDFCQALHIPPNQKYENESGPTLSQCFALLDDRISAVVMPGKNKLTLFQAVIFNFLIGNGDAHGKNFSLLYEAEAERLAPFYDLMCTVIYADAFKAKMAMKLGNEYKFKEISLRHFEQLGGTIGFRMDFVKKQVVSLSQKTLASARDLMQALNKNPKTQSSIYEKIVTIIVQHGQQLLL